MVPYAERELVTGKFFRLGHRPVDGKRFRPSRSFSSSLHYAEAVRHRPISAPELTSHYKMITVALGGLLVAWLGRAEGGFACHSQGD
jgi:hypothetical protein